MSAHPYDYSRRREVTMPTPLTPKRLAELKAMPHDPRNSYAVINREDFDGLLALADAVLNPPPDVKHAIQAVRNRVKNRVADNEEIADWFVSLITPAAKVTT